MIFPNIIYLLLWHPEMYHELFFFFPNEIASVNNTKKKFVHWLSLNCKFGMAIEIGNNSLIRVPNKCHI